MGSLDGSNFLLPLGDAFGDKSVVLGLLLLLSFEASALEGAKVTAALQTDGGNEALDFGTVT